MVDLSKRNVEPYIYPNTILLSSRIRYDCYKFLKVSETSGFCKNCPGKSLNFQILLFKILENVVLF